MLLSGTIEPPPWAQGLISAIERRTGTLYDATWVDDQPADHDERRNRGYSFGSEYAAQSSPNNKGTSSRLRKSRKNSTAADEDEYGDRYDENTARSPEPTGSKERMAMMANQYKGRLRGYSLGSFGRKNSSGGSGSSTPTRKSARDRSHSTATPNTRYHDEDYFDENDDYLGESQNNHRNSAAHTRRRGFTDAQTDIPIASPSSIIASKSSKLTDFMKRPVMPTRKSTSSVQQSMSKSTNKDKESSSSRWRPSTSSKKEKNRLQYTGRYDSDEERYGKDDFGRSSHVSQRDDTVNASPFGDRFNQVEHRFSSEHEDEDGVYGYRDAATSSRNNGSSSGSKSRFGNSMNALSRPLNKRSATAPVQSGAYRPYHDEDNDEELEGVLEYVGNGHDNSSRSENRPSVYGFSERFDENTARQSFESLDSQRQPQITIFKHTVESDNPFEESTANTSSSTSRQNNDGQFFSAQESKDLLSTLDEEIPLSSSYSDVERPTHRLDSRQFNRAKNGQHGDRHRSGSQHYDDEDAESIRSIDSAREYMVVGQKAHKIPLRVREVDNDLMTSPTQLYQTDTAIPSEKKEWRVATFDFEGGQVSHI